MRTDTVRVAKKMPSIVARPRTEYRIRDTGYEGYPLPLKLNSLHLMLCFTTTSEATDPRDKVFTLLPIINDYGHRDIYGEDAPIEFKASGDAKRTGPLDRLLEDLMKFEDEELLIFCEMVLTSI